MKYRANYTANNGTTMMHPIEGNNLKEIIKTIRRIANAERFANNSCAWSVWVDTPSMGYKVVAAGGTHSSGKYYRVEEGNLKWM